jgi:hypothetical protein
MGLLLNPEVALAISIYVMTLIEALVGPVNLDRFQRWLWSTPQGQQQILRESPALSEEAGALLVLYLQYMDTQYEVNALRRQTLTLTAALDSTVVAACLL